MSIEVPHVAHRCCFCGSGDLLLVEGAMEDFCFFVTCLTCMACGPTAENPETAYDRWQSRIGLGEINNYWVRVEQQ